MTLFKHCFDNFMILSCQMTPGPLSINVIHHCLTCLQVTLFCSHHLYFKAHINTSATLSHLPQIDIDLQTRSYGHRTQNDITNMKKAATTLLSSICIKASTLAGTVASTPAGETALWFATTIPKTVLVEIQLRSLIFILLHTLLCLLVVFLELCFCPCCNIGFWRALAQRVLDPP